MHQQEQARNIIYHYSSIEVVENACGVLISRVVGLRPACAKSKFVSTMVNSIMVYACPIWANIEKYGAQLTRV